ncbi:hypothetical protein ACNQFZ_01155 [Schinkia sp. CFF1]
MWKSLGAILIYMAIAWFHVPQLKKDKLIREIWIFSILMLFVATITVLKLTNVPLPSPLDLITLIFKPFLT